MPAENKKDEVLEEQLTKLALKLDKDPPVSEEEVNKVVAEIEKLVEVSEKAQTNVEKVVDTNSENLTQSADVSNSA